MEEYYTNFNYIDYNEEKKRLQLISDTLIKSKSEVIGHYLFKYFIENNEVKNDCIFKRDKKKYFIKNRQRIKTNKPKEFEKDIVTFNKMTKRFLNNELCFANTIDKKESMTQFYRISFQFKEFPDYLFIMRYQEKELTDLTCMVSHISTNEIIKYSFYNGHLKESLDTYFKTKSKYRLRILT